MGDLEAGGTRGEYFRAKDSLAGDSGVQDESHSVLFTRGVVFGKKDAAQAKNVTDGNSRDDCYCYIDFMSEDDRIAACNASIKM